MDFLATTKVSLSGYTLRTDARRFELYEKNRALTLGLGSAVDYLLNIGSDRIWNAIQMLSQQLRESLSELADVAILDRGQILSGIVTFNVKGWDSQMLKSKLAEKGINVSVGGAQATPLYMERNQLDTVLRASVHYYNTPKEVAQFVQAIEVIICQK